MIVNRTRHAIEQGIFELEITLRDERDRYLTACRPLVRALRDAEARLEYLDWLDKLEAERRLESGA